MLVVAVKYIVFIMRADNRGRRHFAPSRSFSNKNAAGDLRRFIVILGCSTALLYNDGISRRPSRCSAPWGLNVVTPAFELHRSGVRVILFVLFSVQRAVPTRGWNVRSDHGAVVRHDAVLGVREIILEPRIIGASTRGTACNSSCTRARRVSRLAVVLAVTGAEALYDMGHFENGRYASRGSPRASRW